MKPTTHDCFRSECFAGIEQSSTVVNFSLQICDIKICWKYEAGFNCFINNYWILLKARWYFFSEDNQSILIKMWIDRPLVLFRTTLICRSDRHTHDVTANRCGERFYKLRLFWVKIQFVDSSPLSVVLVFLISMMLIHCYQYSLLANTLLLHTLIGQNPITRGCINMRSKDLLRKLANNNNNNNNNQFFIYISTFHTRRASQSASNIITPGHWAFIHSLNHLSSLGSIQPVQH